LNPIVIRSARIIGRVLRAPQPPAAIPVPGQEFPA